MKALQSYIDKAATLIEALPYIQNFRGKIAVIKYGGSTMVGDNAEDTVLKDIAPLAAKFERCLPRLSPTIAEKDPIGKGVFDQQFGQLCRWYRVVKIRDVHEFSDLFFDCLLTS